MGASKHIKKAILDKDLSVNDLADMIGKGSNILSNQLWRDTWKFAEVETIAEKLNCEIVFVDKETGKQY